MIRLLFGIFLVLFIFSCRAKQAEVFSFRGVAQGEPFQITVVPKLKTSWDATKIEKEIAATLEATNRSVFHENSFSNLEKILLPLDTKGYLIKLGNDYLSYGFRENGKSWTVRIPISSGTNGERSRRLLLTNQYLFQYKNESATNHNSGKILTVAIFSPDRKTAIEIATTLTAPQSLAELTAKFTSYSKTDTGILMLTALDGDAYREWMNTPFKHQLVK